MPPPPPSELPDHQITPNPKLEKRTRREFSTEYKLRILAKADACQHGELGKLLRREKLYSSQPTTWRKELAPAYDLVSTIPYIPSDDMGLRISRARAFSELTNDELGHLAAKAAIPERLVLDTARETVARFRQHWQAEKHNLPMTRQVREAIETHIEKLPIAQ